MSHVAEATLYTQESLVGLKTPFHQPLHLDPCQHVLSHLLPLLLYISPCPSHSPGPE